MEAAGWHKEDIKAAIRKSGTTLQTLSIENGFTPSILSQSLTYPIPEANKVIAAHLGRTLHELWPLWYDADGNVILRRRRPAVQNATAQR